VLEAARLLAPFDSEYTIRFAAWDEEEIGLVGSYAYAQRAANQGQEILGVLNLDMIAWDSDNDYTYSIATNALSQSFTNDFLRTTAYYQPLLNHNYYYTTASDHASFWQYGYRRCWPLRTGTISTNTITPPATTSTF
jgi:Zn-dependent M28 family amino/carboxypeptidase